MTQKRLLPVEQVKEKFLEKAASNRITFVTGSTGSGKSSQIPQFLLDQKYRILCTQPRRLAVVTIAKRVAEERGTQIGGNVVGYRIGQKPLATSKTQLVFATAGIILEELRVKGLSALASYDYIVVDELHERSVESDLLLACLREYLRAYKRAHVVLMSATLDISSYSRYFADSASSSSRRRAAKEQLEVITISDIGFTVRSMLLEVRQLYLEDTVQFLGNQTQHASFLDVFKTSPEELESTIDPRLQELVRDLVVHIHTTSNASTEAGVILIFLPTYRTLEEQFDLLSNTSLPFSIFALHSSIEVDQCIHAMELPDNGKRKVLLATNIAESSVTINNVTHVIDLCRTLEITWDRELQRDQPKLRWAAKSQCEQRKGRTGRTCKGTVYRLVPRKVYNNFQQYEPAKLLKLSLRKEVLSLMCAEDKIMSSAADLLCRCISPPDPLTVQQACQHLISIRAVEQLPGDSYQPTQFGRFLSSMPLSLSGCLMVALGGQLGLMHESVALAAISGTTPYPICRPFGDNMEYAANLRRFGEQELDMRDQNGIILANLSAWQFWDVTFRDRHRWHKILDCLPGSESRRGPHASPSTLPSHDEWCQQHGLQLTALLAIDELMQVLYNSIYKFRPHFVEQHFNAPPQHTTSPAVQSSTTASRGAIWQLQDVYNEQQYACLKVLLELPNRMAVGMREQMRVGSGDLLGLGLPSTGSLLSLSSEASSESRGEVGQGSRPPCMFYQRGFCKNGASCRFAHVGDRAAPRAACRFYSTGAGCRFGDRCLYSHDPPSNPLVLQATRLMSDLGASTPSFPEEFLSPNPWGGMVGYPSENPPVMVQNLCGQDVVLLLGEGDFSFAEWMSTQSSAKLIATSFEPREKVVAFYSQAAARLTRLKAAGVQLLHEVDATQLPALLSSTLRTSSSLWASSVAWRDVTRVVWNFPFADKDEDNAVHEALMCNAFTSFAALFYAVCPYARVYLSLCNDQYARWAVPKAARESFLYLENCCPFDYSQCGEYRPKRNTADDPFPNENPLTYVFKFCPPAHLQSAT